MRVERVLVLLAALAFLRASAAVPLVLVQRNATGPVCLHRASAVAASRVPAAVATAPLAVVLLHSAGCAGVARALAATGALAALYGAQLHAIHCDVGARQTRLGALADVVDDAPLRPAAALPPTLPAFALYAHGTLVAVLPASRAGSDAAKLVPVLRRANPSLHSVLSTSASTLMKEEEEISLAQRLEARILRMLEHPRPAREPTFGHGLATAFSRHTAASARAWAAKRAAGKACTALLLVVGLAAAWRAARERRRIRAAASRMFRRHCCGPHALEAECDPAVLARARHRSPALRARLVPPLANRRAALPGIRALHHALLNELDALDHEFDAAMAALAPVGATGGDARDATARTRTTRTTDIVTERLIRYEQCLTLAFASLYLDAAYRTALPLKALHSLLTTLLDLAVRSRRSYFTSPLRPEEVVVVEDTQDVESQQEAVVVARVARLRELRCACAREGLVGALVAGSLLEEERVPTIVTPARDAELAETFTHIEAFFASDIADASVQTPVLGRALHSMLGIDRERSTPFPAPGVWRTLQHALEPNTDTDYATVAALHARRCREGAEPARVCDIPLTVHPEVHLRRAVLAALADVRIPVPPGFDLLDTLEDDDAALLCHVLTSDGGM